MRLPSQSSPRTGHRPLRRLLRQRQGAAAVEFAMVLPVFLLLLLGSFEFGLNVYMRAVLEGAMQQAGRNSSLQSAQNGQTSIDTLVTNQVQNILPNATVSFTRQNYATFSKVNKPEDFTDTNNNGTYDAGECFMDANGNNVWDADGGRTGLGGANDVVEYTATVSYPSWIAGAASLGISPTTQIQATTILRNQPFASQPGWSARQVCP